MFGSCSALGDRRDLGHEQAGWAPGGDRATCHQCRRHCSFVGDQAIETYQREEGDKCLASARSALDAAKIAYTPHILLGPIGQSIADFAAQNGCDSVVMGTRGLGGVTGLVLGSVATQVIHAAAVPVTLIK